MKQIFQKKRVWFALMLIGFGVWWFFGRTVRPVYETEVARKGNVAETLSVSGTLEPRDSTDVSFDRTGALRTVYVEKGEHVQQGDVLAKMDDAVLQAQKREAVLGVQTAVQQEWLARRTWDMLKPEEKKMKKIASESARASLATVESSLAKTVLRAPVSGVVTNVFVETGETAVAANPVVRIASGSLGSYVEADVPESDIAKLSVERVASATFDALGKKETFPVRVESIDPGSTVVQDVVYYKVKFLLEREDARFKAGMSSDVTVETARANDVVLLSRRAVKEDDRGAYVEVYDGINAPARRDVETGLEDDEGNVEITKGLSEGEVVVLGA